MVVTIVILVILATISIYAVLGENGLIRKAQESKEVYEQAKLNEEAGLGTLEDFIESHTPKTPAGTPVAKPSGWTSENITPIADGKGGTVPLPNGFYYVGGDIDTGLVISDKQGDTMEASGIDMGNQFVWIPVPNEEALTRTAFDETGQPITEDNWKNESSESSESGDYTYEDYMNEYFSNYTGYPTEVSEYNTMRTQVLKYGGFYIGRYEAGVNSTTLRTAKTIAKTVVSKKGVAPYNYVPWGISMSNIGASTSPSGAVYLAKRMYSSSDSVTSTLIYGCQWDAMCRYIGDANRTTPTTTSPQLTGSVSTDVSKNIYDLAGNCWEWTMEANLTNYRVTRGGRFTDSDPVSRRGNSSPTISLISDSFRCGLYIK